MRIGGNETSNYIMSENNEEITGDRFVTRFRASTTRLHWQENRYYQQ